MTYINMRKMHEFTKTHSWKVHEYGVTDDGQKLPCAYICTVCDLMLTDEEGFDDMQYWNVELDEFIYTNGERFGGQVLPPIPSCIEEQRKALFR